MTVAAPTRHPAPVHCTIMALRLPWRPSWGLCVKSGPRQRVVCAKFVEGGAARAIRLGSRRNQCTCAAVPVVAGDGHLTSLAAAEAVANRYGLPMVAQDGDKARHQGLLLSVIGADSVRALPWLPRDTPALVQLHDPSQSVVPGGPLVVDILAALQARCGPPGRRGRQGASRSGLASRSASPEDRSALCASAANTLVATATLGRRAKRLRAGDVVVDATAGLGRDAAVVGAAMASASRQRRPALLVATERHPVVCALLEDGVRRAVLEQAQRFGRRGRTALAAVLGLLGAVGRTTPEEVAATVAAWQRLAAADIDTAGTASGTAAVDPDGGSATLQGTDAGAVVALDVLARLGLPLPVHGDAALVLEALRAERVAPAAVLYDPMYDESGGHRGGSRAAKPKLDMQYLQALMEVPAEGERPPVRGDGSPGVPVGPCTVEEAPWWCHGTEVEAVASVALLRCNARRFVLKRHPKAEAGPLRLDPGIGVPTESPVVPPTSSAAEPEIIAKAAAVVSSKRARFDVFAAVG